MSARDDAQLLRVLRDHSVPHIVIGGWAVITHGYIRFTLDLDILIPDDPATATAVARAMASVGARRPSGEVVAADSVIPETGWQLETDHGRIDILLEGGPPLDFEALSADSLATEMDGVTFQVASITHLAALKRLAGRPHDLQDIAELEALHGPIERLELPGVDD